MANRYLKGIASRDRGAVCATVSPLNAATKPFYRLYAAKIDGAGG